MSSVVAINSGGESSERTCTAEPTHVHKDKSTHRPSAPTNTKGRTEQGRVPQHQFHTNLTGVNQVGLVAVETTQTGDVRTQEAEHVVEGTVLQHQHHKVLDIRAIARAPFFVVVTLGSARYAEQQRSGEQQYQGETHPRLGVLGLW
jgi:hypothetical protein